MRGFLVTNLTWALLLSCLFVPRDVPGQGNSAPKRRALLVGVNDYQHPSLPPLKYAVRDVADLAVVLEKSGYEVVLLSDDAGRLDAQRAPTKANIERELSAMSARCQRGDTFLLALAGHGLQFGKQAYFCPREGRPLESLTDSLVSVTKIYDSLEGSFAGTKLVLVDACRNDPTPGRGRSGIDADAAPPPQGVGVLFSCNRGQRAYEHDDLQHGVFFHYVLEGLNGQARDTEGEVTFDSLSVYLRRNVPKRVQQLFPGVEQSPNHKADLTGIPTLIDRVAAAPSPQPRLVPVPPPVKPPVNNPPAQNPAPKIEAPIAQAGHVITNGLGMKFAYIPPTGAEGFLMGSPVTEEKHRPDETLHKVILTQGFYLGVYEVTQDEYQQIMGNNPSHFSAAHIKAAKIFGQDARFFPVERVSWNLATEFCRKLSAREGKTYRLPTEAEWEYACRAKTTTPFHFGKSCNGTEANCDGKFPYGTSVKGEDMQRTSLVGRYAPNRWGLHDMHGNVGEWCADKYGDYPAGTVTNPTGPSSDTIYRVFRGGGWYNSPHFCRSAFRDSSSDTVATNDVGFRVVFVPSR